MTNKKQIHLKTISFQQTFITKSNNFTYNIPLKKESVFPPKMRSSFHHKKQIKPHLKPRKQSQRLSVCSNDYEINKKFDEISINRQTMLAFLSKQMRPKSRFNHTESMQHVKKNHPLKCTNQFKFFLNSAISKASEEQLTTLHEFYKNITQVFGQKAINEGTKKYNQRAKTENTTMVLRSNTFARKIRPQSVSSVQIHRQKKNPSQPRLQPWETELGQSNNPYHTDF